MGWSPFGWWLACTGMQPLFTIRFVVCGVPWRVFRVRDWSRLRPAGAALGGLGGVKVVPTIINRRSKCHSQHPPACCFEMASTGRRCGDDGLTSDGDGQRLDKRLRSRVL